MSAMRKPADLTLWGEPFEEHQRPAARDILLDFEGQDVRVCYIDGVEHWNGADVCRACALGNPSQAYSRLDDDEKLTLINDEGRGGHGPQSFVMLNEAGVFNLILTSNKPEAKRFKRWLTHEVLPALRRTGTYSLAGSPVARTAKRLKSDAITAVRRLQNIGVNKASNGRIGSEDGCPRDFQVWHNAAHRGKTGLNAPGLRAALGIRGRKSPLERHSAHILILDSHAKTVAERIIAETPGPLSHAAKAEILDRTMQKMAEEETARLGPGYTIGIRDDPRRGKILDIISPPPVILPDPGPVPA